MFFRSLLISLLFVSCSPRSIHQFSNPIYPGTVVVLDSDPLCKFKQMKSSEELLEDLLSQKIINTWLGTTLPFQADNKARTVVKCKY